MTEQERRRRLLLLQMQQGQAAQPAPQANPQEELPWGYIGEPGNYRPDVDGGGAGQAFLRGAQRGITLEGGDEAIAAGSSLMAGTPYETELASERERGRQNREEHPFAYYGGMIPGAAATSIAGWNAAGVSPVGQSAGGSLLRQMGMGSAEGAVAGGLEGEGGAKERIMNALMMGGIGGAAGLALQPVAWAGQKIGRGAADLATGAFEGLTGKGNPAKAGRALASTVARSGRNADDIVSDVARAAMEGQPEYRLMDALGKSGARRASGIVRSGGDGAEELAKFLEQRGIDASDRMIGFADDAFPAGRAADVANAWAPGSIATPPGTAAQATSAMTAGRGAAADVAYSTARGNAGPVDVRGALSVIDDRIGGMSGSNVTGDGIDATLARFRGRLAANTPPDGTLGVELSDFNRVLGVKQDVQDAIGAAVRAGRNNEARELTKLSQALDSALEGASDGYRTANDSFRSMSRAIDAVDEGKTMARRGRPDDTIPRFQGMAQDEKIGTRIGYGDAVIDELQRNKAAAPDVARAFASTKRTAEAQAMAENPNLFLRRVGREGDMNAVMKRALGGSLTADNLQDVADLGPIASAGRAAADAAQGRFFNAASNVGAAIAPYVTGTSEGTRKLIAEALMSGNPQDVLRRAGRATEPSEQARALLSAILRSSQRQLATETTR